MRKIKLISKSMTSQPEKKNKTIAIHILPKISRSKGNKTMKFGQLIEYNVRSIFLEKLYTNCIGETTLREEISAGRYFGGLVDPPNLEQFGGIYFGGSGKNLYLAGINFGGFPE